MSEDQADEDVEICEIVITAPDAEWLATFCRGLIEDRLAAAVHIIEDIRTLYRWEGEIHDAHEARAHVRTRKDHTRFIRQRVMAEHPYEVPSFVALKITMVSRAYHEWIKSSTRQLER